MVVGGIVAVEVAGGVEGCLVTEVDAEDVVT